MVRVVVTGAGAISPLGHDWPTVLATLKSGRNCVRSYDDWSIYKGLNSHLAVPAADFELPEHYHRKSTRSMGRVALMATRASELALIDAGLLGDPLLHGGRVGIAYGSSAGTPASMSDFGRMVLEKNTQTINANTYIKMMSHTAAVNIGVFFGITGRVITTSSACTSGSQGIGSAYETIKAGYQDVMLAGGADELDVTGVAVFDTLFATSTRNDTPTLTPRPFDRQRDGLVVGEGAGTLVLENYAHARARGAKIHAEIVGYGSNSDGQHVTRPNADTMAIAMRLALLDAGIPATAVSYVNAHGTATEHGDIAETLATQRVFGERMPISSLKSYAGHTLGACGVLEAWISYEMMRNDWFAPTLNLDEIDPLCGTLDYIVGAGRRLQGEY
ncbi:MAG: beta-ketoacyl-ACP synthase II, partial [Lysobacterales bacterium CG02_land_8_20_14_3_00_62_12]